jgi:hypothetical protein
MKISYPKKPYFQSLTSVTKNVSQHYPRPYYLICIFKFIKCHKLLYALKNFNLKKNSFFNREILLLHGYYFIAGNKKIFSWFSLVRKKSSLKYRRIFIKQNK